MQIQQLLLQGHNKKIRDQIVEYVGSNANRFDELMQCFFDKNIQVSQRASWPVSILCENQAQLMKAYHRNFINSLKNTEVHNAIRRNVVRVYQTSEIPIEYEAELYSICFQCIADPKEAIAIRAFSIRVCERIIEKYPELKNELIEIIKTNIYSWSSGLANRGRKFLEKWN